MSNPHPLEKYLEKWIIRTKARRIVSSIFGSEDVDRSYMSSPIYIAVLGDKIAYYRNSPPSFDVEDLSILPADYCDEHWEEVIPRYLSKLQKKPIL